MPTWTGTLDKGTKPSVFLETIHEQTLDQFLVTCIGRKKFSAILSRSTFFVSKSLGKVGGRVSSFKGTKRLDLKHLFELGTLVDIILGKFAGQGYQNEPMSIAEARDRGYK